ncbi:MAG: DUF3488 domain-containing protein [Victivallales bacterium]|nr:DUF3488 domain-containing protein [Victivallales bacterium]
MPVLFALLWAMAIALQSERRRISENLELLIFFGTLLFSLKFVGHNAYFRLIAMGNALVVLQLIRLMSPMTPRNKFISLVIAVTHLAVGSQFILDYSFIAIILLSIVLVPNALGSVHVSGTGEQLPIFRVGWKAYASVFIIMTLFFLLFPRKKFISARDAGAAMGRGSLSQRMDTAGGGANVTGRPFLRVVGDNISYMKSFALDSFDGNTWSPSEHGKSRGMFFSTHNLDDCEYRHVRVLDLSILGSTIPTDKNVRHIKSNFFQSEYIDASGSLVAGRIFPQVTNIYEYWTTEHLPTKLSERDIEVNTAHPPVSEALKQWLRDLVGEETDPEKQIKLVERHFKDTFSYELGAPDLNRAAPVEEFIFTQRSGHCERFASALALMSRMLGIPSRVVIGYMLPPKNQFADYHTIRGENAHAWVEAHIPGKGWSTFDATPYSERLSERGSDSFVMTLRDWLDFVWYSKIVEFSATDQSLILSHLAELVKAAGVLIHKNTRILAAAFSVVVMIWLLRRAKFAFDLKSGFSLPSVQLEAAEKFYSEMLHALARQKILRRANQTPFEFAKGIKDLPESATECVMTVTESFCRIKYGEAILSQKQLAETMDALGRINLNEAVKSQK